MATELAGLAVANIAYFVVGVAAFAAAGWVTPSASATWRRLGAAYMFGIVVVVVPASYLALLGMPVGLGGAIAGLAVVALAVRRIGLPRRVARIQIRRPSPEQLGAVAMTGVALVVLGYSLGAFVVRPLISFDAWAIWGVKGALLYHDPGAAPAALRTGQYGQAPYPLGLPTLQALGFGAMGRFDGTVIGAQFAALAFGFVTALWSLLERRARPLAISFAATAIVVAPQLLYQLLTHYADVPLALFVGLGVAAAAAWSARPDDGWLLACAAAFIGMGALTKSEGTLFAVAAVAALIVAQVGPGWRARARPALLTVAGIASIVLPWQIYCSAYNLTTSDYSLSNVANLGYLRAHSDRLGPTLRELWKQLVNSHGWGYLVLTVAAAILAGLLGKRWRATGFAVVWLALAFAGLVSIYWISVLPTSSNLTNSSYRTIVSLLVGGTALVPLLIAPTDWKDSDQ